MPISWHGEAMPPNFRNWGTLAVFWPLLEKMNVAEIIDRHLPDDPQREYSHGRVLQLLLAARLQQPTALMNVSQWALESGVEHLADIPADKLNDDRLGRALDALFKERHAVLADIAIHVLREFNLPSNRLHYDPTHLLFTGRFEHAKPIPADLPAPPGTNSSDYPPAHITHGYAAKPKMVHAGICAIVDDLGAVPIYGHVVGGNVNGNKAIAEQIKLMDHYLPLDEILMVSDRGTFSAAHLLRLRDIGHHALCSVPWENYRDLFNQHRATLQWQPARFLAVEQQRRRDLGSPHENYRLAVLKHQLTDAKSKKNIDVRVLFVFSSADKKGQQQNRLKAIAKIEAGLKKIQRAVEHNSPNTDFKGIPARVAKVFGKKQAGRYFQWNLVELCPAERDALPPPQRGGRRCTHRFEFAFDQALADADALDDGYSALVTTAPRSFSCDSLFTMFKQQTYLEQAHHQWKTPLAVRPVFLKTPERVEALVYLMHMALTAYHLIQRQYRVNVANDDTVPRLEKRLTTEAILRAFRWVPLRVERKRLGNLVSASTLTTWQRTLLRRLGFSTPNQQFQRRLPPYPVATG